MKKRILIISAALTLAILSACGVKETPAPPPAPAEAAPADEPVMPIPADEPVMPEAAAETTTEPPLPVADETDSRFASDPSGEPKTPDAAETREADPYDEAALISYAAELAHFFPQPLESAEYLNRGRSFAFFLLRQTYLDTLAAGVSYRTAGDIVYLPESGLVSTAKRRLGLDISVSDIFEWPFGEPEGGECPYDTKAALPDVGIDGAEASFDENAGAASVSVTVYDISADSPEHTTLIYRFVLSDSFWKLTMIDVG